MTSSPQSPIIFLLVGTWGRGDAARGVGKAGKKGQFWWQGIGGACT